MSLDTEIVELTETWCRSLHGKDSRIGVGAALNVITTIGNYSTPEVRSATAMFLRRVAESMEAIDEPSNRH